MGILLFLFANKLDPHIMEFKDDDIQSFTKRVTPKNLRLDPDELQQSFYLIGNKDNIPATDPVAHVEQIHINKETCDPCQIPVHLRKPLFNIIEQYTTGFCELQQDQWKPVEKLISHLRC